MKKLLVLLAAAITATNITAVVAADGQSQKVVYHINYKDEATLKAAMGNIQNHITAVGQGNVDIKVVLHGDGVELLRVAKSDRAIQDKIMNLKGQDVGFEVCNNTLRGRKIDYKNDLWDVNAEDIVPSGVAELAYLQQKGYVYIKP